MKKIVIILVLGILILLGASGYILWSRGKSIPNEENTVTNKSTDKTKETATLINEQKFSMIELNDDGFSAKSIEVPLGGILEIRNNTDRNVQLDIRAENFAGGLKIKAGETGYSPVFTEAGEYTVSEFIDGEINEEISLKITIM